MVDNDEEMIDDEKNYFGKFRKGYLQYISIEGLANRPERSCVLAQEQIQKNQLTMKCFYFKMLFQTKTIRAVAFLYFL